MVGSLLEVQSNALNLVLNFILKCLGCLIISNSASFDKNKQPDYNMSDIQHSNQDLVISYSASLTLKETFNYGAGELAKPCLNASCDLSD